MISAYPNRYNIKSLQFLALKNIEMNELIEFYKNNKSMQHVIKKQIDHHWTLNKHFGPTRLIESYMFKLCAKIGYCNFEYSFIERKYVFF